MSCLCSDARAPPAPIPIMPPLEKRPASGGQAIAASGGKGARIAKMYIFALAGEIPCPPCRLRAEVSNQQALTKLK